MIQKNHNESRARKAYKGWTWILLSLTMAWTPVLTAQHRLHLERPLMGTTFKVVVFADDRVQATDAMETAFKLAEDLEKITSDYRPESELSQLSGKEAGKTIRLSPWLYELLDHSQKMAEQTHGAFDPTLGALTKRWRLAQSTGRWPESPSAHRSSHVEGWKSYRLDHTKQSITLLQQNMCFDLGGVAKGFAADLMFEHLSKMGLKQVMVSAGGDIRVGEAPPGKTGWRIALQTLELDMADGVCELTNAAVSTSGDLYRFVEIDGIRYSHILDPSTGIGLTQRIAAVVIANEAKWSDPLATAACVMGAELAQGLKKIPGVHDVKLRTAQESSTLGRGTHPNKP